ncbi:MAG: hypothetical protein QF733_02350 [Phycisphaerales bacterium]|jgi:hypothetical protein|nr:hypothetical protein [Phycisphaerales bacterium]
MASSSDEPPGQATLAPAEAAIAISAHAMAGTTPVKDRRLLTRCI